MKYSDIQNELRNILLKIKNPTQSEIETMRYVMKCVDDAEKYKWHYMDNEEECLPSSEKEVEVAFIDNFDNEDNEVYITRAIFQNGNNDYNNSIWEVHESIDLDYDENSDKYYIPYGWYEKISYFIIRFSFEILAWRYINPYESKEEL